MPLDFGVKLKFCKQHFENKINRKKMTPEHLLDGPEMLQ